MKITRGRTGYVCSMLEQEPTVLSVAHGDHSSWGQLSVIVGKIRLSVDLLRQKSKGSVSNETLSLPSSSIGTLF